MLRSGQKLLILTLQLEQEVLANDWSAVSQTLSAREAATEGAKISARQLAEIQAVEERVFNAIRAELAKSKAEMRQLGVALRLASQTAHHEQPGLLLAS